MKFIRYKKTSLYRSSYIQKHICTYLYTQHFIYNSNYKSDICDQGKFKTTVQLIKACAGLAIN